MSPSTCTRRLLQACTLFGLLLGTSTTSTAGVITYAGTDFDLGGGWRTSTVPKNDIDGNNVLGSDGWFVAGGEGSQLTPAYLTSLVANSDSYPGNASYYVIDNPNTTPGATPSTIVSGTLNPFPGTGSTTTDLSFTFGAGVPDIVRVGLMIDNLDYVIYNPSALQVVQDGGPAASVVVDTTGATYNDQVPDWVYFDIQGAQTGETYDVLVTGGTESCACLGAVSFDSAVPEPSSFGLVGIGAGFLAVAVVRRRRPLRFPN